MIPTWDAYFLVIADAVSRRSRDPRCQVGAVITGPEHREIRSTGYNGFPRGVNDQDPKRWERPEKHSRVVHAEANAIVAAARVGTPIFGCDLYTTLFPCLECSKLIAQAGIRAVVVSGYRMSRYADSSWLTASVADRVRDLLHESGVSLRIHYEEVDPKAPTGSGLSCATCPHGPSCLACPASAIFPPLHPDPPEFLYSRSP